MEALAEAAMSKAPEMMCDGLLASSLTVFSINILGDAGGFDPDRRPGPAAKKRPGRAVSPAGLGLGRRPGGQQTAFGSTAFGFGIRSFTARLSHLLKSACSSPQPSSSPRHSVVIILPPSRLVIVTV
jgi:hypothetical protein